MTKGTNLFPDGKGEERETRQRILDAARRLMAQKGYVGATTRLIASAAGVNEVTIFRHFGSKEGILDAMVAEMEAAFPVLQQSLAQSYTDPREMLIRFGRTFFQVLCEQRENLMICLVEVPNRPELVGHFSRLPFAAASGLLAKLEEMHREGWLPPGDFAVAAHMYISSYFYAFMVRYRLNNQLYEVGDERLYETAADLLLNGLTAGRK
ncbi:TetR/AcrR family transcriptional regulator [Brevibacillus humidisoli]|uniref:TetR/AcrR family transcriptional regulator n=1 Tax=Brevibacillus humidisoli TaxID=2895522 RepID=UPI001E569CFA|nr:TetR/AcrR family transcriptional regulator [Brevibacillus humidisoli]UFJ40231.1 TetR/AcrR family transcriptional regulator [Brevibacillus humidisoli]